MRKGVTVFGLHLYLELPVVDSFPRKMLIEQTLWWRLTQHHMWESMLEFKFNMWESINVQSWMPTIQALTFLFRFGSNGDAKQKAFSKDLKKLHGTQVIFPHLAFPQLKHKNTAQY